MSNHMTLQNMNGVSRHMAGNLTIRHNDLTIEHMSDIDQQPQSGDDDMQLTPRGLDPKYAPWWIQPPLRPGEITTYRRTPAGGEVSIQQTADREGMPLTPSNDERNLPSSWTGKPLKRLPAQNYPGSYPHGWIPYEQVRAAVGPEMGPRPFGWHPAPEMNSGIDAAAPVPYSSEDQMVYDISGFSSLHDVGGLHLGWEHQIHRRVLGRMAHHLRRHGIHGLGDVPGLVTESGLEQQLQQDAAAQAAAGAVTRQATTAQAAGASPSVVDQIINYGAQAAAIALKTKYPPPKTVVVPKQPTPTSTYVYGGVAVAGALGLAYMLTRKKGGRRR